MISIVTCVKNREELDNFKLNLANIEADYSLGLNVLVLVSDKDLYLECRKIFSNQDEQENLVVFDEEATFKNAAKYLTDNNALVFLLNEKIILPPGTLKKLYQYYVEKPTIGFITGLPQNDNQAYWVKDLYGSPEFLDIVTIEGNDTCINIDTCSILGVLTQTVLYKSFFCDDDLKDYGDLAYGIKLRRRGYENYMETSILYKEKTNENNNV